MEKRQQRTITAFENILGYLEKHPIQPEPPLLSGMKKSLRASIDRIRQLGSTQHTAMTLDGGHVDHRRTRLRRDHLIPLVRTVKPLLHFEPGGESVMKVPHARADALTVAQSALAMAKLLKPKGKLMAAAGYSATYLSELQHEARELALAAKQTVAARQTRAKATFDIAVEFRKASKAVTVIDGFVLRHLGRDESAVRFWKNSRRVGARHGRPPQRKSRRGESALASPMDSALVSDAASASESGSVSASGLTS